MEKVIEIEEIPLTVSTLLEILVRLGGDGLPGAYGVEVSTLLEILARCWGPCPPPEPPEELVSTLLEILAFPPTRTGSRPRGFQPFLRF